MTKALVNSGGGLMVPDQEALLAALTDLLDNPDKRREMGRKSADFVRVHQGGTRKTLDLLKPLIDKVKRDRQP